MMRRSFLDPKEIKVTDCISLLPEVSREDEVEPRGRLLSLDKQAAI